MLPDSKRLAAISNSIDSSSGRMQILPLGLTVLLATAVLIGLAMANSSRLQREAMLQTRLETVNVMVSAGIAGALNDKTPLVATRALQSLDAFSDTVSAVVLDLQGDVFARYPAASALPVATTVGLHLERDTAESLQPVLLDGRPLGRLYLHIQIQTEATPLLVLATPWLAYGVLLMALVTLAAYYLRRFAVLSENQSKLLDTEQGLRRAVDDAAHKSRARSRFLTGLSNDIRARLHAMVGYAQIQEAQLDAESPAHQVQNTEHMLSACWDLLLLINNLTDIGRIEEGKLSLSPEDCKLSEVVSHSASLVMSEAKSSTVRLEIEDSPLIVRADYTRLKQVLVSLLNNAIKYNWPGGKVSFSASLVDGLVECEIRDSGVGIAEADREAVFQVFTGREHEHQNEIKSSGASLALSQKLMGLMGGSIDFESEPGQGTTFFLRLEAVGEDGLGRESVGDNDSAEGEDKPNQKITVCYIEDNPASLELMKAIMNPMPNVTLLTSTTAEEGIELALKHRPGLMIFDINLPGMNGVTAAKILKQDAALGHIPLIALSADALEENIQVALAAGFEQYLTKPLDVPTLINVVNEVRQRGDWQRDALPMSNY